MPIDYYGAYSAMNDLPHFLYRKQQAVTGARFERSLGDQEVREAEKQLL